MLLPAKVALLFFVSLLLPISLGAEYRISTVSDFISFSNAVNDGTNYSGTTVFLDSDIDFSGDYSEKFTEIGNYGDRPFLGVFDGQGHTISSFALKSSYQSTGLFGFSNGLTIQNVVVDDTCSLVSSFTSLSYYPFVGGIIGYCYSSTKPCTIENSVNMANVTFNGDSTKNIYIGGIAGYLYSPSYQSIIKNCANYGSVTHSGTSGSWVEIGGIAGISEGAEFSYNYIQNCLNYGTLSHNGTSKNLIASGIVGLCYYIIFDNCVNSGEISTNKESTYIGSIVGYIDKYTEFTHCYWSEDINYDVAGYVFSTSVLTNNHFFNPSSFELNEPVTIGGREFTSLINALNAAADYYTLRDYSHWLFNEDRNAVSFAVKGMKLNFTLTSQIILLPSLASSGCSVFDGWYKDSGYLTPLTDYTATITESGMTLYGKTEENTNSYTITFDTRGGSPVNPITEKFGTVVTIPSGATRDYCDFLGWETEYGDSVPNEFTVPAHNIILYASWLCTRITTPEELISFSNAVNDGTNYSGTTVFLDSDIDFSGDYSERFTQIGNYGDRPFLGVFDGQGHTISNLALKSSSYQYAGLFGFSNGLTIQNVVVDDTCSLVSSYTSTSYSPFVGGIIGYCYSSTKPCTIENSVNMANVTFNGDSTKNIYIGGIVGDSYSITNLNTIKNCVNYGSVTYSGTSGSWVEMGGIAGTSKGTESSYNYIQDCLNYGTLSHDGTSSTLAIGGIIGISWYTVLDNCVNSGVIYSNKESTYIGSIIGYISAYTEVAHCYWSENVKYDVVGYTSSAAVLSNNHFFNPSSFELDDPVTIGGRDCTSLVGALNAAADYYTLRDYSHWLLNKDENTVSFVINGMKLNFTLTSQIILLPSLASSGSNVFDGWYKDSGYLTPLIDYAVTAMSDMTLYGRTEENTNSYTITFDTKGGKPVNPITRQFGTVVAIPSGTTREYCEFLGWETEYGEYVSGEFTIPAHNITLYASWLYTRITTPEELISFSNAVNDGTSYSGSTVFLDSDIDFSSGYSERFIQTGNYYDMPFLGVFDGQGHTISNLALNSSSYEYTGLFGYSDGSTVKNVVIDGSCSIVSSFTSSSYYPSVGSIIGECDSREGLCTIENSVNMASVTFNGDTTKNIYIGGIIGYSCSIAYQNVIKNCANYGSVTHSGVGKSWVEMGGISGISQGTESSYNYIQDCLNYGTLSHDGTSSTLAIGGIIGISWYTVLDNCVNSGVIYSNKESTYIGSIIGYISAYTEGTHCYWSEDINYDVVGYTSSAAVLSNNHFFNSSSFELDEPATIGDRKWTSLVGALNAAADYYTLRDYSHWLLNKGENAASFAIDGMQLNFTLTSQIILLPSLANSGSNVFDGWYKDSGYLTPLTDYTATESGMTLYGRTEENTNSYTITFDTKGGKPVSPITEKFRTVVTIPSGTTRDYCEFLGWENEYGDYVSGEFTIPAHNIILYASWLCTRITTPEELISFSNAVNDGTSFSGSTVFLDSDIDFSGGYSERFIQIGNYGDMPFLGVFDGQGHTISNLVLKSSSYQYTGLFGFSSGLTIQNVVIDDSCSIVSSYTSTSYCSFAGGIIGKCDSSTKPCTIENSVNMANVTFNGKSIYSILIGGIIGYLYSITNLNIIKNCVNYGSVTHSGIGSSWVELGGIAGSSQGAEFSYNYIQNCLNYGTLSHDGTSNDLVAGGVVGSNWYTSLDNCVNFGVISANKESTYIGNIVGYIDVYTEITHCYWTNSTEYSKPYGYNVSKFVITNSSQVSLNITTMDELNEYVTKNNTWSSWSMLHLNGGIINSLTYDALIVTQSHFPGPVREGNTFLFWCKDAECTTQFNSSVDSINEITDLHAKWIVNNYTVTFDFGNGTVLNKTFNFNTSIEYPKNNLREGYRFDRWDNAPECMPAKNLVVTALWTEIVTSKLVEIVLATKEIGTTKEEVSEIIREFTDEEFVINKIEHDDETTEVKVIIKFVDEEKAGGFIRVVNEDSTKTNFITRVNTAHIEYVNSSPPQTVMSLFFFMIIVALFFL